MNDIDRIYFPISRNSKRLEGAGAVRNGVNIAAPVTSLGAFGGLDGKADFLLCGTMAWHER